MFSSYIKEGIEWGGRALSVETGKIARQADGAVVVKYGDTTVLCTVVFAKEVASDASFFPLTVNYQEKFFASGKIPGGFMKREGKPSDKEVLISRLIDRPIRPLFPDGFLHDVQVICTTLSYDEECDPAIAAMVGTSAALSISGVPFLGPIAAARVGYSDSGEFVLNPKQISKLDLVVAGTREGVLMVESEAQELPEDTMLDAVMFGFEAFQPVITMIERLKSTVGKEELSFTPFEILHADTFKSIEEKAKDSLKNAFKIKDKKSRNADISQIRKGILETFSQEKSEVILDSLFQKVLSETMRSELLKTKQRIDGRGLTEIRPIFCEVGVLPRVHGSALFTRGETQALVVTTLGSKEDSQIVDDICGDHKEPYLLHYNFPPYSVGETGRMGAPGRREIGHGKLAWRATHPILPLHSEFPYTIRIVSEVTESNGSSSMATVCGSSLSMMNAGIPLRSAISGIAMGLVKEKDEYVVLSDIIGDEDHLGDMDFKVAGTAIGITALQMDIKITSINREIIRDALAQAHEGRLHILGIMNEVISQNTELNPTAPRMETLSIDKDKIRDLIGPGGKMIREICETTQSKIDIDDNGNVSIFAVNKSNLEKAVNMVKAIGCPPEVGQIFEGKVVKITDFGAFVNIGYTKEGLVHISNIADHRIKSVDDVLKEGQAVKVKVIGIDEKNRIKLSMKGL